MRKIVGLISRTFAGLQLRLLLLVALTCAPLVALTLRAAWEERRHQTESWRQRSRRLMEEASREEQDLIAQSRQLLVKLAESSPARSGNRRACKRLVDELFGNSPRYANLVVARTNGEIVASALPLVESESGATRHFLQHVLETGAFTTGNFPAALTNGRPTLNFGYPITDASGAAQGVVCAALDLRWLSRSGSQLPGQLPKGATWVEVDPEGTILARYPAPEAWVGRPYPQTALLQAAFSPEPAVTEGLDAAGTPTIYGFATMFSQLAPDRVTTILSIPKQALFAGADRALAQNLTWLGLGIGLAMGLGWVGSTLLILRPLKALVRASARLATGDLSTRTELPHGRDELGQLTLAFDSMAAALEQREKDREHASNKLQVLSHRFVNVQETERRHIARELHDEIGQSLTAAEMNLQAALKAPGAAALGNRLKDSIKSVERVLEQVHDLSLNLRPSMLDDLGLEPALRWYTTRQAALTGLTSEFQGVPLEERLDPTIETECFRVAQEALTNVVRHAQASAVTVKLRRENGHLHLSVRDNGVGFNAGAERKEAVHGASLGLLSMEERTALAGGGLELISAPGQGTEVHAWFPLRVRPVAALAEATEI